MGARLLPAPKIQPEAVKCGSIRNRSEFYQSPQPDPSIDSPPEKHRDSSKVDYYLTIDPSQWKKMKMSGLLIKSPREPYFGITKYFANQNKIPLSQNDLALMKVDLGKDEKIMVQYRMDGQLSKGTVVSLKDLRCSEPEQK